MRIVMTVMLLTLSACASGPSLDQAVSLHNTARRVILAADEAYAPVYAEAYKAADQAHPEDDVAHARQMESFDGVLTALQSAKLLEQALHLAIDQWQQGFDDGTMAREAAACGVEGLELLAAKATEIPNVGAYVYATTQVLAYQLEELANGAQCVVKVKR